MSVSDEESFVILGSSPLPSLANNDNGNVLLEEDTPGSSFTSLRQSQIPTESNGTVHNNSNSQQNSLKSNASLVAKIQAAAVSVPVSLEGQSVEHNSNGFRSMDSSKISNKSNGHASGFRTPAAGGDASLAASFIMGDINADVLKTSVYSQFPSLCSMEACAEDVVKLQTIMSEYIELKNTLAKVNLTMKQFYNKTQQWKDDMQRMEQQYQQQLQDCQSQIASLRNENLELKREVDTKIEQIKIFDELRLKDHSELVQSISVKSAQISNMSAQIEKLEQLQLASFEYVPKNEVDSKEKPDYVDRLEHQRQIKECERQLSELLAENLDLKDLQKQYIDEITCLKVNLTAAEELIVQSRSDIDMLKAKDIEKTETFIKFDTERNHMREELTLLRQQIDVYSKDFEMERNARQNLAGEKDHLLQDLRALQRKNQELIELAQSHYESIKTTTPNTMAYAPPGVSSVPAVSSVTAVTTTSTPKQFTAASSSSTVTAATPIRVLPVADSSTTPSSSFLSSNSNTHRCPICSKTFKSLTVLQSHVNACLDNHQ